MCEICVTEVQYLKRWWLMYISCMLSFVFIVFLSVAVPPSDSPRVWEIGVIFGNGFGNRTASCSTAQADVT